MKSKLLLLFGIACTVSIASCDRDSTANGDPPSTESRSETADVSFARGAFEELARGDMEVAESIDWQTLQSRGENVGALYVAIDEENDRRGFREGFITQFSASFRESGGRVESFDNWRAVESDTVKTVVTADSSSGMLKLTVNHRDGERRLAGIEIER